MKSFSLVVLLCCASMLSPDLFRCQAAQASELQKRERRAEYRSSESRFQVPAEAVDVFEHVLRTGRAPEDYVGGRVWQNREHRLPPGGNYREYDTHPKVRGKNRGAERIIVDISTRKGWYTGDHYRTFVPIKRRGND
jgi:guanyl-specific ribonuclease Sa